MGGRRVGREGFDKIKVIPWVRSLGLNSWALETLDIINNKDNNPSGMRTKSN